MLKPMGYNPGLLNCMGAIMLAYFSNLGLPRSGEVLRAGTLNRYEKIPFDKLMGTIILERAIDVLMLLVCIAMMLSFAGDKILDFFSQNATIQDKLGFLLSPWFWIASIVLGLGALFLLFKSPFKESSIIKKVLSFIQGIKEGIMSVSQLDNPLLFWMYSVGIWILYFLMTYVCFLAFEPTAHLSAKVGFVVFVFGTLGIVFPSPGGMGSYHWLVTESLGFYDVSSGDGFSFANIIFFSIQIFCNVFFGILSLILLPWLNRNYDPEIHKR